MTHQETIIHDKPGTSSPWGRIQSRKTLAPGITIVETASHGGIHLSQQRWGTLPAALQCNPYGGGRWFEEDAEAIIPLLFFREELPAATLLSRWRQAQDMGAVEPTAAIDMAQKPHAARIQASKETGQLIPV